MNKFIGVGNLTKDVVPRTSESGFNVFSNVIAIKHNYKNSEGEYDSEFLNIVAYQNTADYLNKYAVKGSRIFIEGMVVNHKYEKDGETKYITKIVVSSAQVLSSPTEKKEEKSGPQKAKEPKKGYDDSNIMITDEDLPF